MVGLILLGFAVILRTAFEGTGWKNAACEQNSGIKWESLMFSHLTFTKMTNVAPSASKKEELDLEELQSNEFAVGVIRGIDDLRQVRGRPTAKEEFLNSVASFYEIYIIEYILSEYQKN